MKKLLVYTSVFALAGCMMGGDSSSLMGFGGGGVERGDMPQELADRSSSVTGMGLWGNSSSNVVAWLEGLIGDLGGGSSIFGFTRESSANQGISQTQIDTFQSTKYNNAVKILKNTLAIWNADDDATTSKEDLRRAWLILGAGRESLFESMYNDKGAKYVMERIQSRGDPKLRIANFFLLEWDDSTHKYYVENWDPIFYNIENASFSLMTNESGASIDNFSFVLTDDVISGIKYYDGMDEIVLRRKNNETDNEIFVSDDNTIAVRYKSYGKGLLKYADFGEMEVFHDANGDVENNLYNNFVGKELFAGGYYGQERDPNLAGDQTMNFSGTAIGKIARWNRYTNPEDDYKYNGGTWYTGKATIAADGMGNMALMMPFMTYGNGEYDVNVYQNAYGDNHMDFLNGNGESVYEVEPDSFGLTFLGSGTKPTEAIGTVTVRDIETAKGDGWRSTLDFDAVAGAKGGEITDGVNINCQWCSK